MRIITSDGNESLNELAKRLYKLRAGSARADIRIREAADALARANPTFKRDKHVPAGAVIVLPDVEGFKNPATGRTVAPGSAGSAGSAALVAQAEPLRAALADIAEAFSAAAGNARDQDKAMMLLLKKNARELLATDDESEAEIKLIDNAASDRSKELEAHTKRVTRNLGQLSKHFEVFVKRMS
jgi:hypothetical protein